MKDLFKDLKFKAIGDFIEKSTTSGKRIIRGYASVSDILDRQNEVITHEALVKAKDDLLRNSTIFHEHKHSELPVGKTIAAEVDSNGLLITVEFTKAKFADDLWKLIEEGIVNRFSIGGVVKEAQEKRDKSGNLFNEITKIELFETSIVGLPANPAARFELVSKSFNQAITEELRKKEGRENMTKKENEVNNEEPTIEKELVDSSTADSISGDVDTTISSSGTNTETTVEKSDEVSEEAETEEVEETEKTLEELVGVDSEEAVEEVVEKEEEVTTEVEKGHTNVSTGEDNLHWHEAAIDDEGNGETTTIITKEGYTGDANHKHTVVDGKVQTKDDHDHDLLDDTVEANAETTDDKSVDEDTETLEEEVIEKDEETTSLETEVEAESEAEEVEETEEEEIAEESEELDEKTVDERILDTLSKLVDMISEKKTEETKADDIVEETKSDETEEVEEVEETESLEEPENTEELEEVVTAKSEEEETEEVETTLEKTTDVEVEKKQLVDETSKEEEKEEEIPTRKSEVVIIADTPYADQDEARVNPVTTTKELKKQKDTGWSNIIFGSRS